MSRKSDLPRYNQFAISIERFDKEKNKDLEISYICNLLNLKNWSWVLILHDKDFLENGEPKHAHYHLILYTKNSTYQVMGMLHTLSKFLDINVNMITIDKLMDMRLMLRYLLHLDNLEKHQYDSDDLLFDSNSEYFQLLVDKYIFEYDKYSVENIVKKLIEFEGSLVKFINYCGLSWYQRNYHAVQDILKELKQGNKVL